MKKLMIAAAIVCAAAMSQAASCSWTAIPFTSNQTSFDTYTPKSFQWVIVETATADNSGLKFENGVLTGGNAFSGGTAGDIQSPNALGGETMLGNMSGATAGKYYSMLIWNEDDKLWGISDAILGVNDPSSQDPTSMEYTRLNDMFFTNGTDPLGAGVDSLVASQAVPEPTSGLLLLLGVAGLALRRRRA